MWFDQGKPHPTGISQGQNNLSLPTRDRKGRELDGEGHVAESSCGLGVGPCRALLSHIEAGGS